MKNQKPRWISLAIIGLIFLMALVEEAILPLSPAAETWALVLWVILFYGVLMIWVRRNNAALELEPPPLDCAGQSIIDFEPFEPAGDDSPEPTDAGLSPARKIYRPVGRSEAY